MRQLVPGTIGDLRPPDECDVHRGGHLVQIPSGVLSRLYQTKVCHIGGIVRVHRGHADLQAQAEECPSTREIPRASTDSGVTNAPASRAFAPV